MKLQMKIVLFFSVFVFVVSLCGGVIFYQNNVKQYRQMEQANLQVASGQLVAQMESKFREMEGCINYALSNPNILDGIRTLGQELPKTLSYVAQSKRNIQAGLNTVFVVENSYRTIFFNRSGDVCASFDMRGKRTTGEADFTKMPYLDRVDAGKGSNIIIGSHPDIWEEETVPAVFSILKAVQGHNMGYVEVQKLVSELAELKLPETRMKYYIFINGDELLYSNDPDDDQAKALLQLFSEEQEIAEDPDTRGLVARHRSSQYDMQILVSGDLDKMNQNHNDYLQFTFMVSFAFFLLAVSFVILISHIVTKPMHQLQRIIERTNIENLGEQVPVTISFDEVKALSNSYQAMQERLKTAMVNEKRLSQLHIQAQFDALQAQINPHFLYNVLNIISSRGVLDNDDSICEMCGCLANMLRYSTSNRERDAYISDEVNYLNQYFYLLKMRYEHKLSTQIEIDEEMLRQRIPKLTLQQIVENSINHGLKNKTGLMEIQIRGWIKNGFWYLSVQDNGEGFSQESLALLQERFEEIKKMILSDHKNMELEIGGMGLVNTYARCLICYQEAFSFEIRNLEQGAKVILGAPMQQTGADYA